MNDPRLTNRVRVTRQQRRAAERSEKKRSRGKLAAGAAMVLGAAGFGAAANAAPITVNSNADTVAVDGVCTLREALLNANDVTGADQTGGDCAVGSPTGTQDVITFASSVTGTIAVTSRLTASDSVVIQGPGPSTLALDGGGTTGILYASIDTAGTFDVSVTGLTLQNGNTFTGGAIGARHANLTLDNDVFQNNVGRYGSGAINFNGSYGTNLTITNSTLSGNSALRAGPAGALGVKYSSATTVVTLDHVTISGNHAGSDGGAIFANLVCGASMTISSSVITGNDAGLLDGPGGNYNGSGGGIYVRGQGLALGPSGGARKAKTNGNCVGALNINDSTVSGNAADADGGGIYGIRYVGVTLLRTTVSGNTTTANGGGLDMRYRSSLNVADSTFVNNQAAYDGGGIAVYEVVTTVNNTTINGNSAGNTGGGVYFGAEGGTGPYSGTINNSIISNNTGGDIYVYTGGGAAALTVSFTDVTVPTTGYTDGGGNISVDPQLGALQDNGGPAQGNGSTFRPLTQLPGPPVIDVGDTATAANPFDERQFPRVQGTAVDMGAVEAAAGTISFSSATYSGFEGGSVTLTVTRAGGDATVSADVVVTGGTATGGGVDYTYATTTVTFLPGETTKTITIPLTADGIFDPGETINLALQNLTGGATAGPIPNTVVTINEVGTPGALQFSSPTYTVTENGGAATITVQRVGGSSGAVSVTYATSNGTATAGADYTAETGALTWADGDTADKTFTIPILDDNIVEGNETVNLTLSGPTNGATLGTANATLTITDFEPGTISVAGGATATVNESAGQIIITLNRTVASNGPVTVSFSTSPGTATSPADFTSVNGTVTWADGDTAPKTITIPITVDTVPEPQEKFTLNLSTTTPGAVLANPVVTITIVDAATIPTLAFWMKLMLALGCAGVGIVMLKNGRMLVIVAATGLALAAAPKLHAATSHSAKSAAHQRSVTAVASTVTSVTKNGQNVVAQVGDTTLTVPRHNFALIDMRAGHPRFPAINTVTAGTPAVLAIRPHRVRLLLYDTAAAAQQAAQRISKP